MNWKALALATTAASALLGAAPAFADPPRYAPAHGWRSQHHHYRPRPVVVYAPPRVYYAPAPVYYAPPPVYYAPPPVVYVPPPRPVIYGRIPVSPDLHVSFGLRL